MTRPPPRSTRSHTLFPDTTLCRSVLVLAVDWRVAFYVTGRLGVAWLVAWWIRYRHPREHPRVTPGELAWIEQDPADPVTPIPWAQLITTRETWAYALGKFFIDPIWWFFLFWLPGYLFERYDMDLTTFSLRSEAHTSKLKSLLRISYAVFCLNK